MPPGEVTVVADDLTGAAEVAAVGWRRGLEAEVHTEPGLAPGARLAVLDIDSRTRTEGEARKRAREAGAWLLARGAGLVYKKVDSVLRGFVRAEIEEMLASLEWDQALIVPANPGLARVARDGRYFIGETPVHETDFARDPLHPIRSSHLVEMLGGRGAWPLSVGVRGSSSLGKGLTVAEATSREDLMAWAAEATEHVLPAGAAEFFDALLEFRGFVTKRASGREAGELGGRRLFVCGSSSEQSRRWLKETRSQGRPVLSMPPALFQPGEDAAGGVSSWAQATRGALRAAGTAALAIDHPLSDEPGAAGRLETLLIGAAEQVVRSADVTELLVEGGATAAAAIRRFGWKRLSVVRELAPGVVSLRPDAPKAPLLTMKPGSYAWPEELGG